MSLRALLVGLAAIAVLPAGAQTITVVSRSGPAGQNLGWWTSGAATSQYVSWTQTAGTEFSSAVVYAALCTDDGNPASGMAYLVSQTGTPNPAVPGSNQIGPTVSFTVPATSTCQNDQAADISHPVQLNFGNINLPAASNTTYYLVIYDSSSNLGWIYTSTATVEEACDTTTTTACPNGGVSTNNDGLAQTTNSSPPSTPPSYPPGVTYNYSGSPSPSPVKGMLFTVAGNTGIPTTSVPTVTPWVMGGTILLLLGSALFLMRRPASEA